jgi:hypothetical protein
MRVSRASRPRRQPLRGYAGPRLHCLRGFAGPRRRLLRGLAGPRLHGLRGLAGPQRHPSRGLAGTQRNPQRRLAGPRRHPQRGQATVELVGMLPVVAAIGIAAYTALAAQAAGEQAGHAAEAGAIAHLQDRDPRSAARAALPPAARRRTAIAVRGRRVTVRVRPPVPLIAAHLEATATTDAGPEPSP